MGSLKIDRQATTASEVLTFMFDVRCSKFLIKNLSGGVIHVTFNDKYSDENSIYIPEDTAQVIIRNELTNLKNYNYTDTICVKPEATSNIGVEVQCLKFVEV